MIEFLKEGQKIMHPEGLPKARVHSILCGDLVALELESGNITWKTTKNVKENYVLEEGSSYFVLDLKEAFACMLSDEPVYIQVDTAAHKFLKVKIENIDRNGKYNVIGSLYEGHSIVYIVYGKR